VDINSQNTELFCQSNPSGDYLLLVDSELSAAKKKATQLDGLTNDVWSKAVKLLY